MQVAHLTDKLKQILPVLLSFLMGCSEPASNVHVSKQLPGKGIAIQGFHSDLQEEAFQTQIIMLALEALGYDVKPPLVMNYRDGYQAIANNQLQWTAVHWTPSHNHMFEQAGGEHLLSREGVFIAGAAQGYLIDKRTAQKYNIKNLADLKNPALATLFDLDENGKANLIGCQKSWACFDIIEYHIDAYDLRRSVEQVSGPYAAHVETILKRYNQQQPILYYSWTPHWLSSELVPGKDVVWLEVPFSAHPRGTDTELANGKNYGFNLSSMRILSNREFNKNHPAAAALFSVATINIHAISQQNQRLRQGENKPEDIKRHAEEWIRNNQAQFNDWLETAREAAH